MLSEYLKLLELATGPVGPPGPVGPCVPPSPGGPCIPWAPLGPCGPWIPCAPLVPTKVKLKRTSSFILKGSKSLLLTFWIVNIQLA